MTAVPPVSASPLRSYRLLTASLMGAVVVIGIAIAFTIGRAGNDRNGVPRHPHAPGAWIYVAVLLVGIVAATLAQTVGYRVPAVASGQDPAQTRGLVLRAYQKSMFLRFALSEAVAIVTIALVFAADSNTILPYVLAAVIAELLMAYHVWPSARLIERVQQRMDRDGGRSDLPDALSGPTPQR